MSGRMKIVWEECEDEDAAELEEVMGRTEGMASWMGRKEPYNFRSTALPFPLLAFLGSAAASDFLAKLADFADLSVLLALVAFGIVFRCVDEELTRK